MFYDIIIATSDATDKQLEEIHGVILIENGKYWHCIAEKHDLAALYDAGILYKHLVHTEDAFKVDSEYVHTFDQKVRPLDTVLDKDDKPVEVPDPYEDPKPFVKVLTAEIKKISIR